MNPDTEWMRVLSDDDLLIIVADILARPGSDYTQDELDDLNLINDEMRKRHPQLD